MKKRRKFDGITFFREVAPEPPKPGYECGFIMVDGVWMRDRVKINGEESDCPAIDFSEFERCSNGRGTIPHSPALAASPMMQTSISRSGVFTRVTRSSWYGATHCGESVLAKHASIKERTAVLRIARQRVFSSIARSFSSAMWPTVSAGRILFRGWRRLGFRQKNEQRDVRHNQTEVDHGRKKSDSCRFHGAVQSSEICRAGICMGDCHRGCFDKEPLICRHDMTDEKLRQIIDGQWEEGIHCVTLAIFNGSWSYAKFLSTNPDAKAKK